MQLRPINPVPCQTTPRLVACYLAAQSSLTPSVSTYAPYPSARSVADALAPPSAPPFACGPWPSPVQQAADTPPHLTFHVNQQTWPVFSYQPPPTSSPTMTPLHPPSAPAPSSLPPLYHHWLADRLVLAPARHHVSPARLVPPAAAAVCPLLQRAASPLPALRPSHPPPCPHPPCARRSPHHPAQRPARPPRPQQCAHRQMCHVP